MPGRLADRLQTARGQHFLGREDELAQFCDALDADVLPFSVLYVCGPSGIGKTSLLRAYGRACSRRGIDAYYLDGHDVEATPRAFQGALTQTLGQPVDRGPAEALAACEERCVLLVDTFERLAGLEGWMRRHFLPRLPEHVLVVLAGQHEPPRDWRLDPGWQALMRVVPLRNLDRTACRSFLERSGIPDEQHEAIWHFTYGHPLALALVADLFEEQPGLVFDAHRAPGVVKALLNRFTQHVPGPAHRAALEACALVSCMTETLLQAMLATDEIHELFVWLGELSFTEVGPRGLMLHDLAREVLAADLHWRHPDWYAELHGRARTFYSERLKNGTGSNRDLLADYMFLSRHHPLVGELYALLRAQWSDVEPVVQDAAQEADWPALLDMVREHEGEEAARIAEHWFRCQPDNVLVYRDADGVPRGFQLVLALEATTREQRRRDPGARRAWHYLQHQAPLREGERATLFRFWMARDTYQDVSPVQSVIFLAQVQHYLGTPGLAFTFLPCRADGPWGLVLAYADMPHLAEASFSVDGRGYALYGHDWRAVPPSVWLDRIAQRRPDFVPAQALVTPDPVHIVLSRNDFAAAVRGALKQYTRPDKLTDSPLLHARVVTCEAGTGANGAGRVQRLRRLLDETTASLEDDAREVRYACAVQRTYLDPAPTQEKAAELLDLPFSTYRRYLKRGIERVTDILWQRELGNL